MTNSFNAEQGTAGVPAVPFRADELLLRELQDWLQRSYRLALSFSSLSRLLTPPNWPLKKSLDAAERDTVAHQEKRVTWRTQVDALDPVRLVFADERGLMRSVTRRYGRAPTGQPVPGAVPLGHWEVTTLIRVSALNGLRASFSDGAPTDADVFQVFVQQIFCPALRPGDVVIWDNLLSHKSIDLKPALGSIGATLLQSNQR